jgi:ADP-ribose pyrophosphatase
MDALESLRETEIASEQVYQGVMLDVRRDRVRLPDGGESIREWIKHPGAAAVVPVFEDGRVLLLRQFRYGPGLTFVEVPAGKMDHEGEDPADVARRELEEETGYTAATLIPLGHTFPCIGYSDETIHYFLARDLSRVEGREEEGEFVEPFTVPFDTALAWTEAGEVLDAKSEVALYRAAAYLRREAEQAD